MNNEQLRIAHKKLGEVLGILKTEWEAIPLAEQEELKGKDLDRFDVLVEAIDQVASAHGLIGDLADA